MRKKAGMVKPKFKGNSGSTNKGITKTGQPAGKSIPKTFKGGLKIGNKLGINLKSPSITAGESHADYFAEQKSKVGAGAVPNKTGLSNKETQTIFNQKKQKAKNFNTIDYGVAGNLAVGNTPFDAVVDNMTPSKKIKERYPWDQMPYKSEAQKKWMHINEPKIAQKWDKEISNKNKPKKKTKKISKGK